MKSLIKKKNFIIGIAAALIVLVIIGSILLFNKGNKENETSITKNITNNYIAYIKINPVIKLEYSQTCSEDSKQCNEPVVSSYVLINEDAKSIYKDTDLIGSDNNLFNVLELIIQTAKDNKLDFNKVQIYSDWNDIKEYINNQKGISDTLDYEINIANKEELNNIVNELEKDNLETNITNNNQNNTEDNKQNNESKKEEQTIKNNNTNNNSSNQNNNNSNRGVAEDSTETDTHKLCMNELRTINWEWSDLKDSSTISTWEVNEMTQAHINFNNKIQHPENYFKELKICDVSGSEYKICCKTFPDEEFSYFRPFTKIEKPKSCYTGDVCTYEYDENGAIIEGSEKCVDGEWVECN